MAKRVKIDDNLLNTIYQQVVNLFPEEHLNEWREANRYIQYQDDPVAFGEKELKETYTEDVKRMMHSVRDNKITVAISGTATGKCVAFGERIILANGDVANAEDLIDKMFDVWSVDQNLNSRISSAYATYNGEEETAEITTDRGKRICRTLNHPLMCGKFRRTPKGHSEIFDVGWKKVEDLEINDLVLTANKSFVSGARKMNPHILRLLAYIIGDGCCSSASSIGFTQQDGKQLEEFKEDAEAIGCEIVQAKSGKFGYRLISRSPTNPMREILKSCGLFKKDSFGKFVPDVIFALDNDQVAMFISRLYATDGWASSSARSCHASYLPPVEIGFTSVSRRLCEDLQILLLRFGIAAYISERKTGWTHNGEHKNGIAYNLIIADSSTIIKFADLIGIFGKEEKVQEIKEIASGKGIAGKKFWMFKDLPEYFRWERVKQVKSTGVKKTVAITVPGDETYVTQFVEHNSHSAGSLALWWYRCFPNSKVFLLAAPPEENLRNILWGEIMKKLRRNNSLLKGHKIKDLSIADSSWHFIEGKSIPQSGTEAQREAKFSGLHAPHTLFIADEGDAIPNEVFRGIDGCMSGGHDHLLVLFNPRAKSGRVYDYIVSGVAKVVELQALNHPNVIHGKEIIPGAVSQRITVQRINDQTVALAPGEEPNAKCFKVPSFLVGATAPRAKRELAWYPPLEAGWRRVKDEFPEFWYKVLAKYPPQGSNQLISTEWIDKARSRWDLYVAVNKEKPPEGVRPVLGLDVADMGDDSNTLCRRYGGYVARIESWSGVDPNETADRAADKAIEYKSACVNVDSIGVGASVAPAIRKKGVKANRVMVSEKPTELPPDKEKARFAHLRDQLWWELRLWLKEDQTAMLPPDDRLRQELEIVTYEEDKGKIRIMPKDEMRKLLGRSPDRCDALCLTFSPREPAPKVRKI